MKRVLLVLLGMVVFGLIAFVMTSFNGRSNNVALTFVGAEKSYGPAFSNVECERLTFAIRSAGPKVTSFDVYALKDEHGVWVSSQILGEIEAGQIYLYLPPASHPHGLRIRLLQEASIGQKTQCALRSLIEKVSGRYKGNQIWFGRLRVVARDFTVKLNPPAEASGSAVPRDRALIEN